MKGSIFDPSGSNSPPLPPACRPSVNARRLCCRRGFEAFLSASVLVVAFFVLFFVFFICFYIYVENWIVRVLLSLSVCLSLFVCLSLSLSLSLARSLARSRSLVCSVT